MCASARMPLLDLAIMHYEAYGLCTPQERVSVGLSPLHKGILQPYPVP